MAGIPFAIAAPAAVASLAYLNAKTSFPNDWALLRSAVGAGIYTRRAQRKDRVNLFYVLEEHALDARAANRSFLAVPPSIPKDVQHLGDIEGLQTMEYSYKQIYDMVLKFAVWLKQEHGVKKDDMVAIDFTNKPQFVILWFAIMSLGARAAFINTNLRGKPLIHCVKASGAKLLVVDSDIQEALSSDVVLELEGVEPVILDEVIESRIAALQGLRVPDEERAGQKLADCAVLIFTSGTTGLPKPAVVSWKKFVMSSKTLGIWLNVKPGDRYYTAMPLYHSSASILNVAIVLHAGATSIISSHFSPKTFYASATASRATMMQYIGEMCRYLLSTPASPFDKSHNLRLAFGNGLRPDVWQRFKERFDIDEIAEFYSATESAGGSFIKSKNNFGLGAVGRAGTLINLTLGAGTVLVRHDVESGGPWRHPKTGWCERVPVGTSGELLNQLDPNNIADKYVGYFNNPKASDSKILRDVFKKGDAWYRSGDLLRRDNEGRLFFVDRIGDTYRWKSENVSTNEVAEAMSTSAHIDEVNVYGVALPQHDGRAGCAAVMLKSEVNSTVLRELAAHARAQMPKFAVPLFLRKVDAFEVTGTAKYTKHGLREQGVDPEKVGKDQVFWLPPGAEAYQEFRKKDWENIVGGGVKL